MNILYLISKWEYKNLFLILNNNFLGKIGLKYHLIKLYLIPIMETSKDFVTT